MHNGLFIPDLKMMDAAYLLAEEAYKENEIPVGAVIVKEGKIISSGRNRREKEKNAIFHAEIEAIEKACKTLGNWRLEGCELYVTLEPCPMCAGAIINSRISKLIFASYDDKAGSCGSVTDLFSFHFNHKPEVWGGIREEKCTELLKKFFAEIRSKNEKNQGILVDKISHK